MYRLYKNIDAENEYCYYIETSGSLPDFVSYFLGNYNYDSTLDSTYIFEIGPKLNFNTAWGTNALNIFNKLENNTIVKIERSIRSTKHFDYDKMTMEQYYKQLDSLNSLNVNMVNKINLVQYITNIQEFSEKEHLGFDKDDVKYYNDLFFNILNRNPTDIELFDLAQSNSEHSRHWIFNGKLILDNKPISETLFQMVKNTHGTQNQLNTTLSNSIIAFKDNASAIRGFNINTMLINENNNYTSHSILSHICLTAETHNFPTGIAPFEGAATGIGGRIRDNVAIGRGGLMTASIAGYCVGELFSSNGDNYDLHTPNYILIQASNGASDYGNKIGEPIILGFTRSFGMNVNDNRIEYVKPIMFSAGIGQMYDIHKEKCEPEDGDMIVRIGGPAYRIGINGSSASSRCQSSESYDIDYSAVQRSDPEMENKVCRVINKCIGMLDKNPIKSIHDQGAGGMGNVTKEIICPTGGHVNLNKVVLGDDSLNATEIWIGEYQEQVTVLVDKSNVDLIQSICARENVPVAVVGNVNNTGNIIVKHDNSVVLNLPLNLVLNNVPQKTYHIKEEVYVEMHDFDIPGNLFENIDRLFYLVSVSSKRFLTNKVDRSVTGLVAQQQCIGPFHTPLSNYAITALSHSDYVGSVVAVGEKPILALLNPEKMARMVVGELITNIMWTKITSLSDIKCSGNWMWPAKHGNEKYHLYTAVKSLSDILLKFGISIDGGKDSLSMTTETKKGKTINSPRTLVLTGYVGCQDIRKKVTPDFKNIGNSIIFIDLANGNTRLGGSSLLHSIDTITGECPDIDNDNQINTILKTFKCIQQWIDEGIILSGHDKSDGGLITTLLEMSISSGYGFDLTLSNNNVNPTNYFFNEELGIVIEVDSINCAKILDELSCAYMLGTVTDNDICKIIYNNDIVLNESVTTFSLLWEQTSYNLELQQTTEGCANDEYISIVNRRRLEYMYTGREIVAKINLSTNIPCVCIIREEGSNGDKEMVAVLYQAGFQVFELLTQDLLTASENILLQYNGIVFVGGFSYSDVFGAAKGWAGIIRHNSKIRKWFNEFYERNDKFSFGVCNGCQLMALLDWIPDTKIIKNDSKRFESRFSRVKIEKTNSIMLQGLEDSVLGVWVAHSEGKIITDENNNIPITYVDNDDETTEMYPDNPNGSVNGTAAICSDNGRHLAMMPHPERCFKMWQWPYNKFTNNSTKLNDYSPWFIMFTNLYDWCKQG